jgi:nucleoside-diphosphate-sugar epimerase
MAISSPRARSATHGCSPRSGAHTRVARRALITGAHGFVGANLCRRLLADGEDVHALVRPGADCWRLQEIRAELPVHEVELRDGSAVSHALDAVRPEWLFHLAAHGAYSWQTDLEAVFATNAFASAQLLELACRRGFGAFVQAGSSSEYGFKDHAPAELEWIEPNSAYAVSKAAATHYARATARARDAHIVTLRLYSAYGPWEEPKRLMPTLVTFGLQGRLPALVDPLTARDFVFVEDVCDAFVRAAATPGLDRGTVLNVGTGTQTSLAELVELVRKELSVAQEPQWSTMAPRAWDTSVWVGDCRRIVEQLGWRPRTTLSDGVKAMIGWLREPTPWRARYVQELNS